MFIMAQLRELIVQWCLVLMEQLLIVIKELVALFMDQVQRSQQLQGLMK